MLFSWIGLALGSGRLPKGVDWWCLYGVALLCGVGFTMSLFIGSLAFGDVSEELIADARLGIFIGSVLSGVAGYFVLRWAGNRRHGSPGPALGGFYIFASSVLLWNHKATTSDRQEAMGT